ncbi:MAG: Rrf2 family transcriptional regulator [Planctomycetes bacterium]|nr:Rrf2 family transcriptional regulator [Planctomycetota bacterium]
MLFSQASEYGLRATVELARSSPGEWLLTADLAARLSVPTHYLAKVLQTLARRGILESQRGRQGGFRLAKAAKDISAWDVIVELEDVRRLDSCVMGETVCCDEQPCPLHQVWKNIRSLLVHTLQMMSLQDLAQFPGHGIQGNDSVEREIRGP